MKLEDELDEIKRLIARDKHEVNELKAWKAKLLLEMADDSLCTLDRFDAYKGKVYCERMVSSIENQLSAYGKIVGNIQKQAEIARATKNVDPAPLKKV